MKTLRELLEDRFGVKTTFDTNPVVSSVAATVTKVFSADPNRYAFVLVNTGANDVYLKPSNDVSVGDGVYLAANGGFASLSFDEDFELVGMEWFAIANGGASSCYSHVVKGL